MGGNKSTYRDFSKHPVFGQWMDEKLKLKARGVHLAGALQGAIGSNPSHNPAFYLTQLDAAHMNMPFWFQNPVAQLFLLRFLASAINFPYISVDEARVKVGLQLLQNSSNSMSGFLESDVVDEHDEADQSDLEQEYEP